MNQDRLLERIEILWNSYWQKQSVRLFNHSTDMFMDCLLIIPYCKFILDKLKEDYPFTNEDIINYSHKEWQTFIRQNNNMQILSFLLHWYEMRRSDDKFYYDGCICLGYSNESSINDKIQMFKTDVIRPIIDYIIFNLQDEKYVLYLLDRYIKRLKLFDIVKKKIKSLGRKNESVLQDDLCLFLYDYGIDTHKEEVVGDGRLDILTNYNGEYLVIEVKYIKDTEKRAMYIERIKAAISQIKEYMLRKGTKRGCLLIYTEKEMEFIVNSTNNNGISILSVYIGNEVPSKVKFETIKISV